jgi:hypothetical protein
MLCGKCGDPIPDGEDRQHGGLTLCEDCYLGVVAMPKTCDPWAVYSAKNTVSKDVTLTSEQHRILELIKARGPVTLEQACQELNLTEQDFRTHFATLRHMELARGCKKGAQICYTLFNDLSS